MSLSQLRKVALFACLCSFQVFVSANPLEEYLIYETDIDNDGDTDYLLKLAPQQVEIPYDINLSVERSAQQYLLRQQANGSFNVEETLGAGAWEFIEGNVTEINYIAGGQLEIAVRIYGADSHVIVLGQGTSGRLALVGSIGQNVLLENTQASIVDVNNDGLDDIVISGNEIQVLSSVSVNSSHDNVQNLSFNTWVGADGSANASLPIWLPKSAGPVPSLNISYSSNSGNGPLGLGTHLSGSSKIHYCPPTADVKGTMAATPFTTEEDLCLDGQHLVLISGNHIQSGAVYVLENNAQSKITFLSSVFELKNKNGNRLTFGLARNNHEWYLTNVADEFGNSYELAYKYYADVVQHDQVPLLSNVTYGDVSIDLIWQARTDNDVLIKYKGGQASILKDRLSKIEIKRNTTNLKTYDFSYVLSSGRSTLSNVSVCSGSNAACVSSTVNWNTGTKQFSSSAKSIKSLPNKDPDQKAQYLDINGDGYVDIMYSATDTDTWKYHLGSESGFGSEQDTGINTGSGSYASYARPISLGADHMSGLIVAKSSITNDSTGEGAFWVCAETDGEDEDNYLVYKGQADMNSYSYHKDFQGINAHWCDPVVKT